MHGNGVLNHKEALNNMLSNKIKRGYKYLETIVHTDQSSVYSPVSFNNIFKSYKVIKLCLELVHQQIIQLSNLRMTG